MLSSYKLKKVCDSRKIDINELASHLERGGMSSKEAASAIRNWQKGLMKPKPVKEDIRKLATALGTDTNDLSAWESSYRYAPGSPRKTRLVTELISGKDVQDAMDILKYTSKRAASMVNKVLKSAVANADGDQADVENLYVIEARVDGAGVRVGTKRWIAKDRGRAHPIRKQACHIHVKVTEL